MRLLQCDQRGNLCLTSDFQSSSEIPPYAILSHTWSLHDGNEVDYYDMLNGNYTTKPGYEKLNFCVQQAARDGYGYSWIDTCCINRASEPELSEAIRSMYRWYKQAAKCYVYLSDVQFNRSDHKMATGWESAFVDSRWFSRGWTVQELLAPSIVEFFSVEGQKLGDRRSLEHLIHTRTNIPVSALRGKDPRSFRTAERLNWAKGRQTKRDEDVIYSLLGLFHVHIPILYGEGRDNAQERLLRELEFGRTTKSLQALTSLAMFFIPLSFIAVS